jgi:hypothetical protein
MAHLPRASNFSRAGSQGRGFPAAFFAIGATLLLWSPSAFCAFVSQLSVGAALPQPLSSAGDTLNRPAGYTLESWFETPNFLPSNVEFNFFTEYLPFAVQNITGANGVQLNINMWGVYGGMTMWGGPTILGIRPMISGDIGGLYDFMTYPNAAGSSSNAAWAFAMRINPGFDMPIVNHLGLVVEFPMMVAFQSRTLAIWESSFSVRWKL